MQDAFTVYTCMLGLQGDESLGQNCIVVRSPVQLFLLSQCLLAFILMGIFGCEDSPSEQTNCRPFQIKKLCCRIDRSPSAYSVLQKMEIVILAGVVALDRLS